MSQRGEIARFGWQEKKSKPHASEEKFHALCFRFQNPKEPPSYDAITKVAEVETVEDSTIEEEVKEITPTAPPATSGQV